MAEFLWVGVAELILTEEAFLTEDFLTEAVVFGVCSTESESDSLSEGAVSLAANLVVVALGVTPNRPR